MKDKILSIVIPAYNVEQYIVRCLESVTAGLQCIEDLDIIVVNDGSKDKTLDLAQGFAEKYPQSVRVIDKPNGGWGTAINRGIEDAVGKYVKTLDSDDWFNNRNLDEFVALLKSLKDVDMVLTSYSEVNVSRLIQEKTLPQNLCGKVWRIDDYLRANNYNMNAPIHAITYRTSLLKDIGFKVCEKFYGDLDYIISPLIYVKSVFLSGLNIYQYFIGRDGQSISIEGYNKHIDDYLNVCKKAFVFWYDHNKELSEPLYRFILTSTFERIRWAYKLLMSPVYSGNKLDSRVKLKQLDDLIKTDKRLYAMTNKITSKKIIPWIYIWRKTGLNLFKLL